MAFLLKPDKKVIIEWMEADVTEVKNIIIVAGGGCFHCADNFFKRSTREALGKVVHSGNAVRDVIDLIRNLIRSGWFEVSTKIRVAPDFKYGVIHYEHGFLRWPTRSEWDWLQRNRMNNINHWVKRAHGWDTGATWRSMGQRVQPLSDKDFLFHCAIGYDNKTKKRLCIAIDPQKYVAHLHKPPKEIAMLDMNFMQHVIESRTNSKGFFGESDTGIDTWELDSRQSAVTNILDRHKLGSDTIIVALSPNKDVFYCRGMPIAPSRLIPLCSRYLHHGASSSRSSPYG